MHQRPSPTQRGGQRGANGEGSPDNMAAYIGRNIHAAVISRGSHRRAGVLFAIEKPERSSSFSGQIKRIKNPER
jgi:hypothetical protein